MLCKEYMNIHFIHYNMQMNTNTKNTYSQQTKNKEKQTRMTNQPSAS